MRNKLGVFIGYHGGDCFAAQVRGAMSLGAECCQLGFWDMSLYTDKESEIINSVISKTGFEISALWAGWSGTPVWDFKEGPTTIGLVPKKYRAMRAKEILAGSEFAAKIGVKQVITHVGFLPADPTDEKYIGTVDTLREIISAMRERGQDFLFEAGQETPITLLRAITDIGLDNVGINLDMANIILYGMGNTLDAVKVFGKYVKNTHIKDGEFPANPWELGREVKAGCGSANIPEVIRALGELDYCGPYTVEREISGEEQIRDIRDTLRYISRLIGKEYP